MSYITRWYSRWFQPSRAQLHDNEGEACSPVLCRSCSYGAFGGAQNFWWERWEPLQRGKILRSRLVPLQVIVFLSTVLRSYQCSVCSGDLPGSHQWTKLTTNELEKALSTTLALATGRAVPCTWLMNGGERVWSRDAQQIPGGVFDWSKLSQQKTRVLA